MKHSQEQPNPKPAASRRNFLSGSMMLAGGAIVGSNLAVARSAHAFGSDVIKIGLVGCGRRGTAAAIEALGTSGGPVKIVAMADAFENNLHTAFRGIKGKHPKKVDVPNRRFVGLDSYLAVMQSEADVVILATPPAFRPLHFQAAVEAGKHVFMEKPLATDAAGVRRVLAAARVASQNALAVAVGLQRRHDVRYQQCIERIHEGAIGQPVFARAYWNSGPRTMRNRQQDQGELEFQLRNWKHFTWLSGDQINEQHIHNLDVINWAMGDHPIEAQGVGGRASADSPGQIFDHHMVEFTYGCGTRLMSQCRQQRGCWNGVGEQIFGTRGSADLSEAKIFDAGGNLVWQSDAVGPKDKGSRQQQEDLFAALRQGEVPFEADYAAQSTMTAILGRNATYSGKIVCWQTAFEGRDSLADPDHLLCLDDQPPVVPDATGRYPKAGNGSV